MTKLDVINVAKILFYFLLLILVAMIWLSIALVLIFIGAKFLSSIENFLGIALSAGGLLLLLLPIALAMEHK